jgi:hypothetical protein
MEIKNYTTIEAMLKPGQVAELLRVSKCHVFDLQRAGVIKGVDVSTPGSKIARWRFRADDVRALMDKV